MTIQVGYVNLIYHKKFNRVDKMAKKKKHGGKREGAGRKVSDEGKSVTVVASVPGMLVDRMNALAEKEGWGRSEAVTNAIRGLVVAKAKRA
jgi:hypothetical protein